MLHVTGLGLARSSGKNNNVRDSFEANRCRTLAGGPLLLLTRQLDLGSWIQQTSILLCVLSCLLPECLFLFLFLFFFFANSCFAVLRSPVTAELSSN